MYPIKRPKPTMHCASLSRLSAFVWRAHCSLKQQQSVRLLGIIFKRGLHYRDTRSSRTLCVCVCVWYWHTTTATVLSSWSNMSVSATVRLNEVSWITFWTTVVLWGGYEALDMSICQHQVIVFLSFRGIESRQTCPTRVLVFGFSPQMRPWRYWISFYFL